jgi:SAM-dependent methyltransferase
MGHETAVNGFVEQDLRSGQVIEPACRRAKVLERLSEAAKTHAPGVAVKLGAGEGELACALAAHAKKLVVVDPSYEALALFREKYSSDPSFGKIECVNGSFFSLPVDYYKADFIAVIDYLDLADSYRAVDEIVRILRHEGILFFGGIVLDDRDVEGTYDEFVHAANPFHNDYYLEGDLDTFLKLKDFTKVTSSAFRTKLDLSGWLDGWAPYSAQGSDASAARGVIGRNAELFSSLYGWDGKNSLDEIYCTAVFRKNAYITEEHKI